jgi:hypothetical protein
MIQVYELEITCATLVPGTVENLVRKCVLQAALFGKCKLQNGGEIPGTSLSLTEGNS